MSINYAMSWTNCLHYLLVTATKASRKNRQRRDKLELEVTFSTNMRVSVELSIPLVNLLLSCMVTLD